MKPIPYILKGNSICLMIDGKPVIINDSILDYNLILDAIKDARWETVIQLANLRKLAHVHTNGRFSILEDGTCTLDGKPIHSVLSERIFKMWQDKFIIVPMVKFVENLYQNPSQTSIEELYLFLEANTLPITDDGCFLAYKIVDPNYLDLYTRMVNNRIGQKPKMDRNEVNPNRNETCSHGYHVCSYDYLPHYGQEQGNRVVVCKVNPKDVVSIPSDYKNAKMRVCEYEVIEEIPTRYEDKIKPYYAPTGESTLETKTSSIIWNDGPEPDDEEPGADWNFENDWDNEDDELHQTGLEISQEANSEKNLHEFYKENTSNQLELPNVEAKVDELDPALIKQTRQIREMAFRGFTKKAIADTTGLSTRQIGRILSGENRKNIK